MGVHVPRGRFALAMRMRWVQFPSSPLKIKLPVYPGFLMKCNYQASSGGTTVINFFRKQESNHADFPSITIRL